MTRERPQGALAALSRQGRPMVAACAITEGRRQVDAVWVVR